MNIEDFYTDLLEEIQIKNDSYNSTSAQSLFNIYTDFLQSSGQFIDDPIEIEYGINGFHISAFSRDAERGALNLMLTDFRSKQECEKLYKKDIEGYIQEFTKLMNEIIVPSRINLDESNPLIEFIDDLCSSQQHYKSLTLWYITNGVYSSRDLPTDPLFINGLPSDVKVVDLQAYQHMVTDHDQQNIKIECNLEAIKVIETPSYTSYLASISGNELVLYYDEYGKRLLESNVRTFLSLRKKENMGIYNTIRSEESSFFFAYNNGLSATASDVKFNNGRITEINNLQIVNGGQTMSTIYKAKKDKENLDPIKVQLKLSVIHDRENYTKYISKISEYANTQSKVNQSDFFSNTYFHKRFKEISQVLRVPAKPGSITSSKWFYERIKGEYLNDQMYKKESEKKKFLLEYPKDQVIDKISISKANLAWDQYPHEVSKGAQQCFGKFAQKVTDLYEEGDPDCNDFLFKKMVSQVILFQEVQKIVSKAEWYSGGYRAQTVPYIISFLSYKLQKQKLTLDWGKIWKEQTLESDLKQYLDSVGGSIHKLLLIPPPGNTNIGTYCKKQICWESIKKLANRADDIQVFGCFIPVSKEKEQNTESAGISKIDYSINNQIKVLELSRTKTPVSLVEFYNSKGAPGITDTQKSILSSWHQGKISYPTEKQAKIIIDLLKKAIQSGFSGV